VLVNGVRLNSCRHSPRRARALKRGLPSLASANMSATPLATAEEIRERMSGNICRCGAYPNIVTAIMAAHEGKAG